MIVAAGLEEEPEDAESRAPSRKSLPTRLAPAGRDGRVVVAEDDDRADVEEEDVERRDVGADEGRDEDAGGVLEIRSAIGSAARDTRREG